MNRRVRSWGQATGGQELRWAVLPGGTVEQMCYVSGRRLAHLLSFGTGNSNWEVLLTPWTMRRCGASVLGKSA